MNFTLQGGPFHAKTVNESQYRFWGSYELRIPVVETRPFEWVIDQPLPFRPIESRELIYRVTGVSVAMWIGWADQGARDF
jgi:hypothetical protein